MRLVQTFALLAFAALLPAQAAEPRAVAPAGIPMREGLTIAQAVEQGGGAGDYEFALSLTRVTPEAIDIEGSGPSQRDANRGERVSTLRTVLGADLESARLHILGFGSDDPFVIEGSTALGPSRAVLRDIAGGGAAEINIRNYPGKRDNLGTLTRVAEVSFPVLLNGDAVVLPAVQVAGMLGVPGSIRHWELTLLDHPVQPLTLKVSYGAENAAAGGAREWVRQIVRIDFPEEAETRLEAALQDDCRAVLPGIYFDFDSDRLNPASAPALKAAADVLTRRTDWTAAIEGHTDTIGGSTYNLDLSTRRAAAVKSALVETYGIAPERLTTQGFGFTRPVATNDTVEGRAQNRRVELTRPCG